MGNATATVAPLRKPTRRSIKAASRKTGQQKRREEALQRQQAARQDFADYARQLATSAGGSPAQPGSGDQDASTSSRHDPWDTAVEGRAHTALQAETSKQYYARQLMQPEWLTDIPADLCTNWYVMPRPEGRRCLVISSQHMTISRHRNGSMLHKFPSILPNGSRESSAGSGDDFCILDCVFHEAASVYYVLDMMCWKGYALYDCSAEFRLFWVQSKLAECLPGPGQQQQRYPFVPVPAFTCTQGGLQHAYSSPVPFQRDGLYFLHKEGHYSLDSTPLAVLWKDEACSQYCIDTDANGVVPENQGITLEYRMDQTVATADTPPVVLGRMPAPFVQSMGPALRPGKLLRFEIGPGGIQMHDGQPLGADLKYVGVANQRRGRADACSKVLFQYMARRQPISFAEILDAADGST
ncbi:hypothetical protein ABBQ32_003801 [Trebouxia sp. C0010 RCD-2024]